MKTKLLRRRARRIGARPALGYELKSACCSPSVKRRRSPLLLLCLLSLQFCLTSVAAQKRAKPALKESDARRAIASARGFELRTSAVTVREISAAGVLPVTVSAEVTMAFRLARVEDERARQDTGIFKQKRLRAVEFRAGDRVWEDFEHFAPALGEERLERARRAIEEAVTEFEARQRAAGGKSAEPLVRGPLTLKQLSAMGSSVIAEAGVEATFRLERGAARGGWRVAEVVVAGESSGELSALVQAADASKAARARAELETVRAALERFRLERGFYVISKSEVVLMDHLSPRYIPRIVRIDPWHRPYRYAGTREAFTLSSDGADGKQGTADDVTLNSGRG